MTHNSTSKYATVADAKRCFFGRLLRGIREKRNLTQADLGDVIGFSQSAVSAIENGAKSVDRATLDILIAKLQLSREERQLLEGASLMASLPDGLYAVKRFYGWGRVQKDILDYEKTVISFREYHNCFIPGLLQIESYTRDILCHLGMNEATQNAIVQYRSLRRNLLLEQKKKFKFVLTEQLLHSTYVFRDTMLDQLESLEAFANAANVEIGLIPLDRGCIPSAPTNFIVYDESLVAVEGVAEEQIYEDPLTIRQFDKTFAEVCKAAVFGEECFDRVRSIRKHIS